MSQFRRVTVKDGTNKTETPMGPGGVTKHCMTCNTWRLPGGFKKNKRTGLMECVHCIEARAQRKANAAA